MAEPAPADADYSRDAFHRGRFHLVQPRGRGHRAGIDAMLLAACVPGGFSGCVADLGAGAGAAGLATLSRCPDATAMLIEREAEMAACARQTLALAENRHLAGRASLIVADLTAGRSGREAAGLADRSADFVIMNPPFNSADDRSSDDPLRRGAHVMDEDLYEKWLRAAAALARPRSGFALIARPQSLGVILAAVEGRFGSAEIAPVHSREGEPAIRIVMRARYGARGRLSLQPPLVLHERDSRSLSERADAICNGTAEFFGD